MTSFAGWGVSWGDSWGTSGGTTPGEMQGSASLSITATLQVRAAGAGGYDTKRKKRFVVKVGNRLVEYGSAQAAAKALDQTETAAPQPIAEVPIRTIKAQAKVFKAEKKVQDLFAQQDFAAMFDLYQQMREEDDAESLLMLM